MPSILWLRQKLKPARLEIWAERNNLPLAEAPGYADDAEALIDTQIDRYPPSADFFQRLKKFDLVISWRGASNPEWLQIVKQHHPNIHFLPALPVDSSSHAMDFRRLQLERLFGQEQEFPAFPKVSVTEEDDILAKQYLENKIEPGGPIVIVHPGASGPRKRWPLENFVCLVSKWLSGKDLQILICTGPMDNEVLQGLMNGLESFGNFTIRNLVQITNLRRLAAVLRLCSLYVGNDSGITHLAAATGIPTLAIFTTTDPRIWAPRGPLVRVLEQPSIEEVAESAATLLAFDRQSAPEGEF